MKPKLKIPTMKSINAMDKPYTGVSFFAGCGGSSTGLKWAGFDMLFSNEFIDVARDTYRANHPGTLVSGSDVRRLNHKKIMDHFGMKPGDLDHMNGSPPCFPAGTLITTDRGLLPIEDIRVGDFVQTHEQHFRPVTELLPSKYKGDMYKFGFYSSEMETTSGHPIYARFNLGGKRKRDLQKPSWVKAKDLTTNHYVGIPTQYEPKEYQWAGVDKVFYHRGTCEYIPFDTECTLPVNQKEFWWLIGRWLGDGWVRFHENEATSTSKKKPRHATYICCDKTDNGKEFREIEEKLIACGLKYKWSRRRTVYRFALSGKEICHFMMQFGKGSSNKFIPGDVLDLPRPLLAKLVEGYLSADGHKCGDNGKYRFSTTSQKLALGISQAVNRVFGIPVAGLRKQEQHHTSSVIEGRKVNCKPIYKGEFTLCPKEGHSFYDVDEDGIIWVPVNTIEKYKYKDVVFNFSVEEDETYVANNTIVHNCKSFSSAGTQDDGWGKEAHYSEGVHQRTDDLFFEFCRALRAWRPKTFDAENVSGLVKGVARGYFKEILQELKDCGYKVRAQLLNASYLDCPQARERVIFVGVREDLPFDPAFPEPRPYQVLVRDMLPHITYVKTKKKGELAYVPSAIASPTITASDGTTSETAGFSCGGFVEDEDGVRRKYTIEELRVICGFPKDFDLELKDEKGKATQKFEQQWERLGRSVPTIMEYHIGRAIIENIHEPLQEMIADGEFKLKRISVKKLPDGTSPFKPVEVEETE